MGYPDQLEKIQTDIQSKSEEYGNTIAIFKGYSFGDHEINVSY
jgi:hypothetical protein